MAQTALPGTAWTGTITDGASDSNGYYPACVTSLRCTATPCAVDFTTTAPDGWELGQSGIPRIAAVGPDGTETPLATTDGGGGGDGYSGGLDAMEQQRNFDPVPAGSTAVRRRIVTGPGGPGSQPVPITITQPLA